MPLPVIPPRAVYLDCVNAVHRTTSFLDASSTAFQIGTIPVGSVILDVSLSVDTAYNAGTTNAITLGTTQANANELMASGDNTPGTPGFYRATRGLGNQLTQVASLPTMGQDTTEGGIGIWFKVATTGTPATTGHGRVILTFVPPTGA